MKNKGFSLAEILLTITIIGIIASMTIPSLVMNIQMQQNIVAWKKTYNIFSTAVNELMHDNNDTMIGINTGYIRNFRDQLIPYLNVIKSCGYHTTMGVCWHTSGTVKWLNGNTTNYNDQDEAGLILADGTFVQFGWVSSSDCNANWGSGQTFTWCNRISFDVNGFKGPNVIGKDIFSVFILKNRVVPEGASGDSGETNPAATCPDDGVSFGAYSYPGSGCAAKYLVN